MEKARKIEIRWKKLKRRLTLSGKKDCRLKYYSDWVCVCTFFLYFFCFCDSFMTRAVPFGLFNVLFCSTVCFGDVWVWCKLWTCEKDMESRGGRGDAAAER